MNEDQTARPAGWYPVPGGQQWWDGRAWGPIAPQSVQVRDPLETNHILHLLLSVFTFGLWLPVWAIIAWSNGRERVKRDVPAMRARAGLPPLEPGRVESWASQRWDRRAG